MLESATQNELRRRSVGAASCSRLRYYISQFWRSFRCPSVASFSRLRYFRVSRLISCHPNPSTVISRTSPTRSRPFSLRDAPPRSNSIGVVRTPCFSDRLNHRSSRRRYTVLAGRENGERSGIRRNLGKSIRQCPPITRQSGLILGEKRVGSPRARSVTSAILIRTVHWIFVAFAFVIVAVRITPIPGFSCSSRLSSESASQGEVRWLIGDVILEETVANSPLG